VAQVRRHVSGRTVEIGGARDSWRRYGFRSAQPYLVLDISPDTADICCDAHDQNAVAEASLDCVILFNVLEHCERPWTVVSNIRTC